MKRITEQKISSILQEMKIGPKSNICPVPTQKPSITVEPILNGHPQTGGN